MGEGLDKIKKGKNSKIKVEVFRGFNISFYKRFAFLCINTFTMNTQPHTSNQVQMRHSPQYGNPKDLPAV